MGRTPEQERRYKAAYRAKKRAEASGSPSDNVRSIMSAASSAGDVEVFPSNEAAVRYEIQTLPMAALRPVEVTAAITLAQIMDDRSAPATARATASDKLRTSLDVLRGGGTSAKSNLQSIRDRYNASR